MPFEHFLQFEAEKTASERRIADFLALALYRATHVSKIDSSFYQNPISKEFKKGDSFLAARGAALSAVVKSPPFSSKFYGPCIIV